MNAMVLECPRGPLRALQLPDPVPGPGRVGIQIAACAVCRTDLHILDGELASPKLPLIPGHEVVGRVIQCGDGVGRYKSGDRVGVPWLGWTCGRCHFCLSGRENLCENARFTGYSVDGGYADFMLADERFCFLIPPRYTDAEAAPLLCAGLIGYRSLKFAGDAARVGIFGFGAAAHIVTQVARFQGREIYAFTRPGDLAGQQFAKALGAVWAGGSEEQPPTELDAAIIFAPVGALVIPALKALAKGGRLVCGGIHMSDIPSFAYELLWGERSICSVANLTRRDGEEFFSLAARVPVKTTVRTFPLSSANEALEALRYGYTKGAVVLVP
jgi:alcohol dehydrogenase, propanol-preferring